MTTLRQFVKSTQSASRSQRPNESQTVPNSNYPYAGFSAPLREGNMDSRVSYDGPSRPAYLRSSAPSQHNILPQYTSPAQTNPRLSPVYPLDANLPISSYSDSIYTSTAEPAATSTTIVKQTQEKKKTELEGAQMKQFQIDVFWHLPLLLLLGTAVVGPRAISQLSVLAFMLTYFKDIQPQWQSKFLYVLWIQVLICAILTDMVPASYSIYTFNSLILYIPVGIYLICANFSKICMNELQPIESFSYLNLGLNVVRESAKSLFSVDFVYVIGGSYIAALFVSATTDSIQWNMFEIYFLCILLLSCALITLVINMANQINLYSSYPDKVAGLNDRYYLWGLRLSDKYLNQRTLKYISKTILKQKDLMCFPSDYKSVSTEKTLWNTFALYAKPTLQKTWKNVARLRSDFDRYNSELAQSNQGTGKLLLNLILCNIELFRTKYRILEELYAVPVILSIMVKANAYESSESYEGLTAQIRSIVGDSIRQLEESISGLTQRTRDERFAKIKQYLGNFMNSVKLRSHS